MNFWRRKSAVPAAQAVQLRGREQHPFTGLRGFTPQRSGQLRLYQAVREAVPVVDAAVCKLIRLSGGVQVSCEDAEMDGKMQQFLERVPVGRGQFGINAFLEQYLDSLLVYGGAVGEMVPAAGNRDLAALLCGRMEQIVAKTSIPPFMLGLNWNSTERMSAQQADMLTTEITAIRRTLTPVVEQICRMWLRMQGYAGAFRVDWDDINLQDEVEEAKAALYREQARKLKIENDAAENAE